MPINSEVLDDNPFLRRIPGLTWWITFNFPQSAKRPHWGRRPRNNPELGARPTTYHFNWHLLHMMFIYSPNEFGLIWNGDFFSFPLLKYLMQQALKLNSFDPSIPSLFHVALKGTKYSSSSDIFWKYFFFTSSVIRQPSDLYLFFQ